MILIQTRKCTHRRGRGSTSGDERAYYSGNKRSRIAEHGGDNELHGHSGDLATFLDFAFAAATVVMLKRVL